MTNTPIEVSVLIPARNEERHIAACLDSILVNDFPQERLEVLVLDGMSEDRTREIVQRYTRRYSFIGWRENPDRSVPAALNLGLRTARGQIILRMDAHTVYARDYIRKCVEWLRASGAANVGGVQQAVGDTLLTQAIALATCHPFGIGNAYFRYGREPRCVDTVYLGAWFKHKLEEVGGFNEQWLVNEDYELNCRLREVGGRILLSPNIRCEYHVRSSLLSLARQYFRYGMWRVKTVLAHPRALRWRQLVPVSFVLALVLSLLLLWSGSPLGWVVPGVYVLATGWATVALALRAGWGYTALLPIVFWVLHFSYALGFLAGIGRFGLSLLFPAQRLLIQEKRVAPPRQSST